MSADAQRSSRSRRTCLTMRNKRDVQDVTERVALKRLLLFCNLAVAEGFPV